MRDGAGTGADGDDGDVFEGPEEGAVGRSRHAAVARCAAHHLSVDALDRRYQRVVGVGGGPGARFEAFNHEAQPRGAGFQVAGDAVQLGFDDLVVLTRNGAYVERQVGLVRHDVELSFAARGRLDDGRREPRQAEVLVLTKALVLAALEVAYGHHEVCEAPQRVDSGVRHGAVAHHAVDAHVQAHRTLLEQAPVSYTHLRAHETDSYLVCRLL